MLRDPALLLPGDRFIIRMFSPVVTIGGGVVVDTGERRYRKADRVDERLNVLAGPDTAARVALLVRESGFGVGLPELVARTGLRGNRDRRCAAPLFASHGPWYVDRAWFQSTRDRLVKAVRDFHAKNPLLPGIAKQDLRSRELPDCPPLVLDALLAGAKELVAEGETVRIRSHKVVLKEDEEQARAAIERAFEAAGLAVPAMADVLAKSGVEAARARSLLQILLREKRLVRDQRRPGVPPLGDRGPARDAGGPQSAALQRRHIQGLDRHLAQVRDPAARVSGSREGHSPRGRRTDCVVARSLIRERGNVNG